MMAHSFQLSLTHLAIPSVRPDSIRVVGVVVVERTGSSDVARVVRVGGIGRCPEKTSNRSDLAAPVSPLHRFCSPCNGHTLNFEEDPLAFLGRGLADDPQSETKPDAFVQFDDPTDC